MELTKATTAFLACHWENDVVGADGAFALAAAVAWVDAGSVPRRRPGRHGAGRAAGPLARWRIHFASGHDLCCAERGAAPCGAS